MPLNGFQYVRYDWDEKLQGIILGSFYIGYVITHVPGGVVASRYGGKYTLILGLGVSSFFTLLTPKIVMAGGSYALIASRIVIGLGEGIVFPGCAAMLACWAPIPERSKMVTLTFSGAQIGSIFGSLMSGILLDAYHWGSVFYFFGGLTVAWIVCFVSTFFLLKTTQTIIVILCSHFYVMILSKIIHSSKIVKGNIYVCK